MDGCVDIELIPALVVGAGRIELDDHAAIEDAVRPEDERPQVHIVGDPTFLDRSGEVVEDPVDECFVGCCDALRESRVITVCSVTDVVFIH